uniref:Ras-related protein Rab-24 n=1 Tax=Paramoeba aestuarina TaxID=180227 RepID=A0A7S4L779_9EUKA|mmetsp:Transcript_32303/g.50524  ORF Transcript_32303/g.50524 Transcript_32303/m.50524 type:complete len:199 (+) Transcript_32303:93-689(+)|eukprot:CAMPEP_0201522052 /NCGR_PEP_ID=MMETSP0161_2-20130828/16429_1 /ASSEMBLY_ACC=CAM_ASM_000251 /TAXON_ID=180227 /ORGANISM="Neoparamoeba aestuarina, Strain SoJaBio B1-5/56/2" /LENGTH=198 /DNA_ID=CAMNT_0047920805 /DNA_START=94 /DNA_END=690 /DNA_ORIENTATION=+
MSKVDVKVVLLGQHDVGKTSLVERYLHDKFKGNVAATVGAAFGAKKVNVGGTPLTLGIWDTAGAERYESMSRIYYRAAKAAVVCFDLTNLQSFEKVKFWVEELLHNEDGCDIYIVGTKADSLDEAEADKELQDSTVTSYAESIGAQVFKTSAKTGAGVNELFYKIAEDYTRRSQAPPSIYNPVNLEKAEEPPKDDSCC